MFASCFREETRRAFGAAHRMFLLAAIASWAVFPSISLAAESKTKSQRLSVEQIVKRHVDARGGLQAWRAVQTLTLSGKMDAGSADSVARSARVGRPGASTIRVRRGIAAAGASAPVDHQVQLPFTLSTERPNKSRLEIEFAGKTAVQVYDGANGWKLRPFLNRDEVEAFTPQEEKIEAESSNMEDPLIDYAKKGFKVQLDGTDKVDGRTAYRLKLTSTSGATRRVWVDAKSFLDVKLEGVPRRMDGKMHAVWVYQRDFRSVQGLKIPFVVETRVEGFPQAHKIVVEKVAVNPKLAASTFRKPKI